MPDIELTSAELAKSIDAHFAAAMDQATSSAEVRRWLNVLSLVQSDLARAGLEAGKAEESMRERAATVADDFEAKAAADEALMRAHGVGPPVSQVAARAFSRQIATAIRALPLTEGGDKP